MIVGRKSGTCLIALGGVVMKKAVEFFAIVVFAIVGAAVLQTDTATKMMFSEDDYSVWLADGLYEAVNHPQADVDAGIAHVEANPIKAKGRTMIVTFDAIGDIGWPTVVRGVTISFVREDGTKGKSFYYDFRQFSMDNQRLFI